MLGARGHDDFERVATVVNNHNSDFGGFAASGAPHVQREKHDFVSDEIVAEGIH
jgi:hypothetical protein